MSFPNLKFIDNTVDNFENFVQEILTGDDGDQKNHLMKRLQKFAKFQNISKRQLDSEPIESHQLNKKLKRSNVKLPNEIWIKIMNYLSTKDLITNMALVCKNFNNLTKEVKFLEFNDITELEVESVIKLLKNFKHLKEVTVATRSKAKDSQLMNQILGAAMDRKNLKHFEIFPVTTIQKATMVFHLNQK